MDFRYNARKQGAKEKIENLSVNGSGIRDISRVLKISQNTVIRTIKKTPVQINPYLLDKVEAGKLESLNIHISYRVEMDELWSYVRTRKRRRWTWYAIERKSGFVVAWYNGNRGNRSLKQLLEKLSIFPIRSYSTDDCHSHSSLLPPENIASAKIKLGKSSVKI